MARPGVVGHHPPPRILPQPCAEPRLIGQPRYLPACNYLQRMALCDVFVWLDTVQYTKNDWENRNKIKTVDGPLWLTVPVQSAPREEKIHAIRIDNTQHWAKKHLESVRRAYAKAPFFKTHFPFLEAVYSKTWDRLMDLNLAMNDYFAAQLAIPCKFVRASDYRTQGAGQDLLVELCRATGGPVYIYGPLGRD